MAVRRAKTRAAKTVAPAGPACPACGRPCTAVTLGGQTPPWACNVCRLGWWQAELSSGAAWLPATRELARTDGLAAAVKAEMAAQMDVG